MSSPDKESANTTKLTTPSMAPSDNRKDDPPTFMDSNCLVTIKIKDRYDKKSHTFLVHKPHICFYSPYFAAALNGQFQEGEKQELELGSVDSTAFAVFINWIYTQRIEISARQFFFELVHLWILADRFLIPRLQNEAIQVLNDGNEEDGWENFRAKDLNKLYEDTTEGSPLRRYIVALISSGADDCIEDLKTLRQSILLDMVQWLKTEKQKRKKYSPKELKQFFVNEEVKESGLRQVGLKATTITPTKTE